MKKERNDQYKMHGKKYSISRPFFAYFKKHYCTKCSSQLSVRFKSKIINSESPEAQYYDFTDADGYPIRGNVDFRIGIFQCYYCGAEYKINEIRKIEKEDKKKRKEEERLRK